MSNSGPIQPQVDAELYMMLGRMDSKLDALQAQLAAMNSRADGHEQRIHHLEQESTSRASLVQRFYDTEAQAERNDRRISDIETTARNTVTFTKLIWMLAGGGVIALCGFILRLFFAA